MEVLKSKSICKILLSISLIIFSVELVKPQEEILANKVSAKEEKTVENSKETANMSSEEKLIRWAYKKLSVYEVVDKFSRAEREGKPTGQILAQKALNFKLKKFQIGRIEEIQNLRLSDLVTLPTGNVLDITPISTSVNSDEYKFSVKAKWKNGQYSSGFDSQWTLGDLMKLEPNKYQDVGKYASYEVTVSLEGKNRTYLAVVLFHNPYQSSQNLKPEFLDYIVGMDDAMTKIFYETKLPLRTKKLDGSNQEFQSNLESGRNGKTDKNQNSQNLMNPCVESWNPNCGGCLEWYQTPIDPNYTFCMVWEPYYGYGGGGEEPGCSASIFYASEGRDYDKDDREHNSGNHQARTLLDHTCTQNHNCVTNCKVVDTIAEITEEGELIRLTVHSTAKDVKINERSGPRNTTVECETAVGYGVKSCWSIFGCSASVSIGISGTGPNAEVSLTPNTNLYNRMYIYGGSCRNGR